MTSLVDVIRQPTPSHQELRVGLALIMGADEAQVALAVHNESELADFLAYISSVRDVLLQFESLSFPRGFGFDAFSVEDIADFLSSPDQFNFRLKKTQGKCILYGLDHVTLRRQLVNGLPKAIRRACLGRKIARKGLFSFLPGVVNQIDGAFEPNSDRYKVVDIRDIGTGHSIYLIELALSSGVSKKLVIKQEELPNQSFFCRLLGELGWPTYSSCHIEDRQGSWEISEYLGDQTLASAQNALTDFEWDKLVRELAYHAALGDVCGRGDRHFENYMVLDGHLLPVDISFLFWEGNEFWLEKYLNAGMSEFSVLYAPEDRPADIEAKKAVFFKWYHEALDRLAQHETVMTSLIRQFYGNQETDTDRKCQFVSSRLRERSGYFEAQKAVYNRSFNEMVRRKRLKQLLIQLEEIKPNILDEHPYLKMYYLADKDRVSCFYLIEDQPDDIEATLLALAKQYIPDSVSKS